MKKQQTNWSGVFNTPVGKVGVAIERKRIVRIGFLSSRVPLRSPKDQVDQHIVKAIKNYFVNPKRKFNLPIFLEGTILQKKIWRALQKIPLGKVLSYGELAKRLNTGPRVVGNACRCNPLPIVIPCHRVVAADGLGGYCGKPSGIKIKKWLLEHENKNT